MTDQNMTETPAKITQERLKQAFGTFPTGITIVTTLDGQGQPVGFTASSFTSVSLTPPLLLICIDHQSENLHLFRSATHFGVNVLAAHQGGLADRFATEVADRFARVAWTPSPHGTPLLEGVLSRFECALEETHTAGDHDILIGRVIDLATTQGSALGYFRGHYTRFDDV